MKEASMVLVGMGGFLETAGPNLLFVLLGIAILQWMLTLPLVLKNNLFRNLADFEVEARRKVSFLEDKQYILWNILPIILLINYLYAWYFWADWETGLRLHFGEHFQQIYAWVEKAFGTNWILIGAIGVAIYGAFPLQLKKARRFRERKEIVYWWDREISHSIFVLRLWCLLPNLVSVILGAAFLVKVTLLVSLSALYGDVDPTLLHPDGAGGLGFMGEMALVVAAPCLIITGSGVVGLLDHRGQGFSHLFGDLALVAMLLPAVWILSVPMLRVHSEVRAEYRAFNEASRERAQTLQVEVGRLIAQRDSEGLGRWFEKNAEAAVFIGSSMKAPAFPVDLRGLLTALGSFLLPFLLERVIKKSG